MTFRNAVNYCPSLYLPITFKSNHIKVKETHYLCRYLFRSGEDTTESNCHKHEGTAEKITSPSFTYT